MKLMAVGCSHTSTLFGTPWPYPLAEELGGDAFVASSPGAGIELALDKLAWWLDEVRPNVVVFQLTEPTRHSIGIDGSRPQRLPDNPDANRGCHYVQYTMNAYNNDDNLTEMFGRKYDLDRFFLQHEVLSTLNSVVRPARHVFTAASLCHLANIPLILWSWSEELERDNPLATHYLAQAERTATIIPGTALGYLKYRYGAEWIKSHHSDAQGHLNSEAHRCIAVEYLLPVIRGVL